MAPPTFGDPEELKQKFHALPELDDYSDFDAFINAEVLLPQNGHVLIAVKVIG